MMAKSFSWTIIFFFVVSAVAALENYMDYGNEAPNSADKAEAANNLRELYRYLVQRSVDESEMFRGPGSEMLQPRAAERSPSLRLRFGRSFPKYPRSPSLRLRFGRSYPNPVSADLISRMSSGSTAFEEN